jgi:hypothetical protein
MEQVARPSVAIAQWRESGALRALIPALADADPDLMRAMDHLPMPGPPKRPQRRINRLTALFLGVDQERLAGALSNLRFSNHEAAWIRDIVRHWQSLGAEMEQALLAATPPDAADIRRWAARTGRTQLGPVMRIAFAVWSARRERGGRTPEPARVRSAYRVLIRTAYRDPIEIADLAADGADLMQAGIPPGPRLGKILRGLLDIVIDDPSLNTRDALLARAMELYRQPPDSREGL